MRTIETASGNAIPVLGLGTWRMGERANQRQSEIAAIQHAIDAGITLIDTAEMYGEGGAEEVIGDAIGSDRDKLFIVSKVYPHNASYDGVLAACDRSLRRLRSDYINLYLLHWPGSYPLSETFDAFQFLKSSGKIRDFGVSNFDVDELEDIPADALPALGCNQIFYNLAHRESEWAVSPWCSERKIPVMAYSPLDQGGRLLQSTVLADVGSRHSASNAQIALAWLLHKKNTVVIPKSVQPARIDQNLAALEIQFSAQDLADLDESFPPPKRATRLDMR